MKHSKKLTRSLVGVVFVVWGAVAFRVYESVRSDDALTGMVQAQANTSKETGKYVYINDVRDPFRYVSPVRKDSSHKRIPAVPAVAWTPPPFKLTGIMVTKKKRTITVEGSGGNVFFLCEGDTLSGMKVLKIGENAVSYKYQKKNGEWILGSL
jgi:type II secretory pathway component PulC